MRLHYVMLIVATVLGATTHAAAFDDNPKIVKPNAAAGERVDVRAQRFLRKHYSVDEDEERGIVNSFEKVKSLLPSKVSDKTLQRWADNNKSPKHALTRLNLGNAGNKLFEKPEFGTWVNYMTKLNQKNPEEAMMSTLMTQYTDDVLSQMIIAAKKVASTEGIATKLQAEQLRIWRIQKQSADNVFKLFQLNKLGEENVAKLVENPQFATWIKYVDDFSLEKANSMMLKTLTKHYTDEGTVKILTEANRVPSMKDFATKLQAEQLRAWASQGKTGDDVFKLFQFDKISEENLAKLLDNPQFATWTKYVYKLQVKNPEQTMVSTLMKHYADDAVYKMLTAAKENPSAKQFATKLLGGQLQVWVSKGKPADDVFNVLNINKKAKGLDELVDNPQFTTWTKYVDDLSANDPEKANAIITKTLTTYYTNGGLFDMLSSAKKVESTKALATDLQKAQINNWLVTKAEPKDVNAWMGVRKTLVGSVERQLFKEYFNAYNIMHVKKTII